MLRKKIRIGSDEGQEFDLLQVAALQAEAIASEAVEKSQLASGEFAAVYERMMERHGVTWQRLKSCERESAEGGFLCEVERCSF